jgi:hypothetical protein
MPIALYAIVYALACVPGLPLGFALFGRRHAAGWIAGAVIGYALTALAIWAPIFFGFPSRLAFVGAWVVITVLVWMAAPGVVRAIFELPHWSSRDTQALMAVWALTLIIAVPPFTRVGEQDAEGGRRYRAYFTADFVWHAALVSELKKFDSPARNPYLAHRPIHYYWTYFLLPSVVAGSAPAPYNDVQTCLEVNAIATALLFVSAIFLCAWAGVPYAWPVATGVTIAIVASSAEGLWAVWRFWERGVPLSELRNLNIDALTSWWLRPAGLRIDGLPRCFWWVPQHSMAYALGLVALAMVSAAGSAAPVSAIVIAGIALAGSAMMNPFVGGIFAVAWGLAVAIDALRAGDFARRVTRHAIAVLPVGLAIGWVLLNRMAEGGGSALEFGWLIGDARHFPVETLALSLGPALLAAAVGLAVGRIGRPAGPVLLAGLSLLLMYFARLNVDTSWVGFRAGQMILVAVPALIARGFVTSGARKAIAVATALVAIAIGTPTTAIDTYNAQDVTNVAPSPNGPWTVTVTADEQAGLAWLRANTPATAIVQMDPLARERSGWSLIPSFAERRMGAGRPISLLGGTTDGSEYAERSSRVRTMYATGNVREAHDIARSLRLDYIWIDRTERAAYPGGMAKFDAAPQFFTLVLRNTEVSIYRVN